MKLNLAICHIVLLVSCVISMDHVEGEEDDEEEDLIALGGYESDHEGHSTIVFGYRVGSVLIDKEYVELVGTPDTQREILVVLGNGLYSILQVEAICLDGRKAQVELIRGGPGHLYATLRVVSQLGAGISYRFNAYGGFEQVPHSRCENLYRRKHHVHQQDVAK